FSAAKGNFSEIVYAGYGIEDENYSDYTDLDLNGKLVLIKAGEPVDGNGNYVITGTSEKSAWSNLSESMGKKAELAVQKGAKGILYYGAQSEPRFQGDFSFMQTNNSGRMQLAGDNDDSVLIVLNETSAKAVKSDIDNDDTPKMISAEIVLNITSGNDKVNS